MNRADLLQKADDLARSAKKGAKARGYNSNEPGNIAALREATVEETEALRLTLLVLLTPLADAAEALLAVL